ncbi:hypothetical protein MRB53_030873 [Persea americana]|uniref:Uncharacterized protein n=1 Tax=Persea americana TaxID=3435 RepID=A0ACC2KMH5_PERAE|nr:hypothetical protein MRB53_030873 [Persea americana]
MEVSYAITQVARTYTGEEGYFNPLFTWDRGFSALDGLILRGISSGNLLALCAELKHLSRGPALDVVKPLLFAKKGTLESDYATVHDWVAVVTPQLESASEILIRSDLALPRILDRGRLMGPTSIRRMASASERVAVGTRSLPSSQVAVRILDWGRLVGHTSIRRMASASGVGCRRRAVSASEQGCHRVRHTALLPPDSGSGASRGPYIHLAHGLCLRGKLPQVTPITMKRV